MPAPNDARKYAARIVGITSSVSAPRFAAMDMAIEPNMGMFSTMTHPVAPRLNELNREKTSWDATVAKRNIVIPAGAMPGRAPIALGKKRGPYVAASSKFSSVLTHIAGSHDSTDITPTGLSAIVGSICAHGGTRLIFLVGLT